MMNGVLLFNTLFAVVRSVFESYSKMISDVEMHVPYRGLQAEKEVLLSFAECAEALKRGDETIRINNEDVALRVVAPDLTLEHIERISPTAVTGLKQIGVGGFGIVSRGQWNGRPVAVKEMKVDDGKQLLDIVHEVTVMSLLNHENLVQFHGVIDANPPSIVMEFVPSGDVKTFSQQRINR